MELYQILHYKEENINICFLGTQSGGGDAQMIINTHR